MSHNLIIKRLRVLKTAVAKWLIETTEVLRDIKCHRDSSTHNSVFTGRLQLETILTLTLQHVDWSMDRRPG